MAQSPLAPHSASAPELKERLEVERQGMAFLLYRDGGGRQQIYQLEDTASRKITVGRDSSTDILLTWDPKVSGVHAEFERVSDDWVLVDDGLSRNGTFVNGQRLHGRCRLQDGDTLRFGDTVAAYRRPARGGAQTTAVATDTDAVAARLSDTQRRVLIALCRPFKGSPPFATPATNQQIADEMFLSVDAVKTHLRALFGKFGVESLPQNQKRAKLVERAFQSGLISERDL